MLLGVSQGREVHRPGCSTIPIAECGLLREEQVQRLQWLASRRLARESAQGQEHKVILAVS